jgi:DNA-binding response OmpR family regulator
VAAIHLLIADRALRDAVTEGVQIADLGDAREAKDMAAALAGSDPAAIILDETAADKKNLKTFQEVAHGKARVFLLGEAEGGWKDNLAVESFLKPLRMGHLLSRLSFYLGAAVRLRNEAVTIGVWRFEPQNRQMTDGGTLVRLTEKETALLDYLVQCDAPVGREELLAVIWGHDGRIETHTLETHIYQLRRKLDSEGHRVANENGAYFLKRTEGQSL